MNNFIQWKEENKTNLNYVKSPKSIQKEKQFKENKTQNSTFKLKAISSAWKEHIFKFDLNRVK